MSTSIHSDNAVKSVVHSFIFSFVWGTVFSGGNAGVGVVSGLGGACVAAVNEVSKPIFQKYIWNDRGAETFPQFFVRSVVNLTLTSFALAKFAKMPLYIFSSLVLTLIADLYMHRWETRSWNATAVHIVLA